MVAGAVWSETDRLAQRPKCRASPPRTARCRMRELTVQRELDLPPPASPVSPATTASSTFSSTDRVRPGDHQTMPPRTPLPPPGRLPVRQVTADRELPSWPHMCCQPSMCDLIEHESSRSRPIRRAPERKLRLCRLSEARGPVSAGGERPKLG